MASYSAEVPHPIRGTFDLTVWHRGPAFVSPEKMVSANELVFFLVISVPDEMRGAFEASDVIVPMSHMCAHAPSLLISSGAIETMDLTQKPASLPDAIVR